MPTVLISGVCERDIDLLLLEEFVASPALIHWLVERVDFAEARECALTQIERSATQSNGESDLELLLEKPESQDHFMLMIENKITASFTPRQAQRYSERGEAYVSQGHVAAFRTILIAPQTYLGDGDTTKGFDAKVSYEAILERISLEQKGSRRLSYVSRMLEAAIQKSSIGWQLQEDQPVTTSWYRYWQMSSQLAPELELAEPTGKPAGSGFVYFKPPGLPKGIYLVHKWPYGNVDLQFAGLGNQIFRLREHLSDWMTEDMEVVKAAKSAVVRLRVPKFDVHATHSNEEELMTAGILAARRLLEWYEALPGGVRDGAFQPNNTMQRTGEDAGR